MRSVILEDKTKKIDEESLGLFTNFLLNGRELGDCQCNPGGVPGSDTFVIKIRRSEGGSIYPYDSSDDRVLPIHSNYTVIAVPDKDYQVSRMVVDGQDMPVIEGVNRFSFTDITANHEIYFEFEKVYYYVTRAAVPACAGIVRGSYKALANGYVLLEAVANPGYVFESWIDPVTKLVIGREVTLRMDISCRNKSVIAKFRRAKLVNLTLKYDKNIADVSMSNSTGTYYEGQSVEVRLNSLNPNYDFVSWTFDDGTICTDKNFSFRIYGDSVLTLNVKESEIVNAIIREDGHLYITMSNGKEFDAGEAKGTDGREVELWKNPDTQVIEWRYRGDTAGWIPLVSVADLKGDTPYIGENGHWYIGGVDTGVSAGGTSILEYHSRSQFPAIGKEGYLYISKGANLMYRWDTRELDYFVVGSDWNDINVIHGGNAFTK